MANNFKTRREYIHVGSASVSLPRTILKLFAIKANSVIWALIISVKNLLSIDFEMTVACCPLLSRYSEK